MWIRSVHGSCVSMNRVELIMHTWAGSDPGLQHMGVLRTQTCSEGRKQNDWFTDSTNEIEGEAGSQNVCVGIGIVNFDSTP